MRLRTLGRSVGLAPVPLLVSTISIREFDNLRPHLNLRDWSMDSGAFSAHNSGKTIDLVRYTDDCERRLREDPLLSEVFALDVIGDWRSTVKNLEYAWRRGVSAIPTFHPGRDPWSLLSPLARDYPKIALGGLVGLHIKAKLDLVREAFSRAWPCRIHGLGMASERLALGFPFESIDASDWESGPNCYGTWKGLGKLTIRGGDKDLRSQVVHYMDVERRASRKWAPLWNRLIEDGAFTNAPKLGPHHQERQCARPMPTESSAGGEVPA